MTTTQLLHGLLFALMANSITIVLLIFFLFRQLRADLRDLRREVEEHACAAYAVRNRLDAMRDAMRRAFAPEEKGRGGK